MRVSLPSGTPWQHLPTRDGALTAVEQPAQTQGTVYP